MKHTSTVPTTASPDFAALPLSDLASELRMFTLGQLQRLLSGQPPASFFEQLPPELLTVIEPPPRPALRSWLYELITRTQRIDDKSMISAVTRGRVAPSEFQSWALQDIARRFGGGVPTRLPTQMLPLLESVAWSDLEFNRTVAAAYRDHLRAKVLFAAADPAVITLNVPTLWLLALTAPHSGRRWFKLLRPRAWHRAAALKRLTAYAGPLIDAPKWAGFWDQLTILAMLNSWGAHLPTISAATRAALAALPVVLARPLASSSPPERGAARSDLAAPRWRQSAPAWYAAYEHAATERRTSCPS